MKRAILLGVAAILFASTRNGERHAVLEPDVVTVKSLELAPAGMSAFGPTKPRTIPTARSTMTSD